MLRLGYWSLSVEVLAGSDEKYYEKCYLVDVDKTLCKEGTEEELIPGISALTTFSH